MYLRGSNPFDLHNAEVLKHQPLQDPSTQLRYLYLLPRTHNIDFHGQTVVRCELLSDVEEQAPRYIGLSYTWGDPQIRRPIIVGDKIFQATANLAIALEHLQDDRKTIIFWIDAICIDQSNLNEKSIQVQRMGHIFASAALVIAWLGPAADESELALRELMRYNNDKPDSYEELKHTFRERCAALPIKSINAFFDRQWFKRVWVGQEVALNKHVTFVCGQLDIQREELLACFWTFVFSSSQSQQESFAFDLLTSAMATQQEEARVMLSLDTVRQALDDKERWGQEDAEKAVFDLSSGMSVFKELVEDDETWEDDLYESYKAFRGLKTLPSDVDDPRQWRRDASRAYLRVLQESNAKNFFVTATDIVGTSRDEVQPGDWVCVLGGVWGVHILREVDGGFYRIVSIANVFPWEDVKNSDASVETITIV
ncbi:uncharacterized protein J4E92_007046 [Alternaria infectoria]|uniref:uncharacterized protein n=1 Tax=Alternaria infectoria TaxID=45303 RepID=UPI00221E8B6E|nr:uncharacterized protein J4E92_007046 [Alternaria infectoria]KAI4925008.1 hypothetical protein J4E92_007046 [Alternaria infectoria]